MTELQRVVDVFEYLKSNKYFRNQQDFVERIGSDKTTVSQILNGKKEISKQFVCKLIDGFPILNKEWLLSGEGEMLKDEKLAIINYEHRGVPYYDVDFIAGFDLVVNDKTINPTYFIDFMQYNRADKWINITGRSMEPLISHGDIIAIKDIHDWDTYILYGEIYAIVTDEYRTVKKVRKSKKGDDFIKLVPMNDEFDEQDIPKAIVRKVFQVLGSAKKIF